MRFKDVERMRPATLKRFVRLPQFDEHLALHRLDCLSSNRHLEAYEFVMEFIQNTPPEVVRPARLLTGKDILDLGYAPGPIIGKILVEVEEAQLNGELHSRGEAISFVRKKFSANNREFSRKTAAKRGAR